MAQFALVVAFASFALLPVARLGFAVPLMSLASFLLYASLPIYFINTITVRQAVVANELQGRVVGTIRTLVIAATPVGALLGGALGQYLGLLPTLLVGAAIGLLAVGWVLAGPISIDSSSRLVERR